MAKYRKLPIPIDAILWKGDDEDLNQLPFYDTDAYVDLKTKELVIMTREGEVRAEPYRHYIIRGVEMELYPCAISIFEKTYEAWK